MSGSMVSEFCFRSLHASTTAVSDDQRLDIDKFDVGTKRL